MADSLRASLTLALKDELSAGLRQVMEQVKQLRAQAERLGFRPLEGADAIINRVDRDVQQLNRSLGATARQAETAAGALRRTGAAELGRAREEAGSARRQAALARQAAAAAGLPSGATIVPPTQAQLSRREAALARQAAAAAGLPSAGNVIPLGAPAAGAQYRPLPGAPITVPPMPPAAPMQAQRGPGLFSRAGGALAGARSRVGAFSDSVGLAGGAMAGISLMAPIREAAEFDNVLTHIAITAGATEGTVRSKVATMAQTYQAMALATRQSSHDVAESAQFLITTGIGEEMTNKLLPIIAKAATAYNTPMRDAVQGAFSMHEELKIAPEDMQGALSATALAAKQGHFSFSDFSSFLPSIAAQAGVSGIRGRGGLDVLLAALETSRRGAGTSGQAATNLQDFLSYINAPIGTKSFAKGGINLPALKIAAEKAGQNPIEAVIEAVRKRTTTMSDAQKGTFLGSIFHNQEARIFAQTMLSELQYYEDTKKKISQAGDQTIDEDFRKAQNLHTRLATLSESSHQLTQRVGTGFSWVVPIGTGLLTGVLSGLHGIDHILPGLADGLIGLTGGMLGLVAVMGVLGTVKGPIIAGAQLLQLGRITRSVFRVSTMRMLVNPWLAVLLLVGAAAWDIYQNWSHFRRDFTRLWGGVLQMLGGVGNFVAGVFTGDMSRAAAGLHSIWNGVKQAWVSVWGPGKIMEKLFGDFAAWVDSWSGGFATGLGKAMGSAIDAAIPVIKQALDGWQKLFNDIKVPTPQGQADQRARTGRDAGGRDDLGLPGTEDIPLGPARKSAYHPGDGDARVQRIHVTFESDIPGRATVRHDGGTGTAGSGARGPMLSRA